MAYLSTTNFTEDKDFIDKWLYTIRTGEMDLSWMKSATEKIRREEANPRRGLTYRDLNLGTYGYTDIPEKVRANPAGCPPPGYRLHATIPGLHLGPSRVSGPHCLHGEAPQAGCQGRGDRGSGSQISAARAGRRQYRR